MGKEEARSLRNGTGLVEERRNVLETDKEVDPKLEVAAIQKRLDGGPRSLSTGSRISEWTNRNECDGVDRVNCQSCWVQRQEELKFKIHEAISSAHDSRDRGQSSLPGSRDRQGYQCVARDSHDPAHTHGPGTNPGAGKTVASPKQFWGGWHISYKPDEFP